LLRPLRLPPFTLAKPDGGSAVRGHAFVGQAG